MSVAELLESFEGKSSLLEAAKFVREMTRYVGPGFHPDDPFSDYIEVETRRQCFAEEEAEALDRELDRARSILESAGIDICAVAIPVQRRLLWDMGLHFVRE